ncbi:hypothetical protein UFOVP1439_57 [uncultured Caudovirales phage]|uniref:Uncharacterized protein n=1 Tax=uncultured Caudovirales phage TaxID=2100421 RepID=A0A6J5QKQ1_9CAUD|nr:hypothetical protein UFOVP1085_37 [uncultured Caudovirales phage]CAB4213013.1 hypothetical protein UFOVP1439_57 [uncultured Caudovirales phage]
MATPTTGLGFQNFFSATLTGDITASSVDILMDTIPASSQGFLVIEPDSTTAREVIFYTSKTALKVVCTSAADGRGQDDTSASAHSTGAAVIMAPVAGMFEALQDASAQSGLVTRLDELTFDYVQSGGVWTADSVGVNLNASMTAMVCYIDGRRISIGAVTARAFTTNVDTYIDVLSAGDGTGTLVYTTAATNAASPALASNSMRIGIIQAAATITATTKVNQGQEDRVFPIASSIPYAVTDSLGNLICPRDPNRKLLGYRQILTAFSTAALAQVTGLSVPILVPTGRKIRVNVQPGVQVAEDTTLTNARVSIWDGTVSSGTQLQEAGMNTAAANQAMSIQTTAFSTLSAGLHTINIGLRAIGAGNASITGAATTPAFVSVELF